MELKLWPFWPHSTLPMEVLWRVLQDLIYIVKNVCGVSVALALGKMFSSIIWPFAELTCLEKKFWSRDIALIFSESGNSGYKDWIDQYQSSGQSPKLDHHGIIQGAVSFEIDGRYCDTGFDSISVAIQGTNGLLPNLDLLNVLVKLAETRYVDVNMDCPYFRWLPGILTRHEYITKAVSLYSMLATLAFGSDIHAHSPFLEHHIDAITIRASESKRRENEDVHRFSFKLFYEIIEGVFRSLNNLLESLHQSFFFYILPNHDRFISIANYLPTTALFCLSFIFKVSTPV